MPDSRSRVLASIRQSLASARLPQAPAVMLPTPSLDTLRSTLSEASGRHSSLVEQFAKELRALSGVFLPERVEKIPALVTQLLRDRGADSVLAWQAESLPVPGLLDHLRREGVKVPGAEIPLDDPMRSQRLQEIERVRVGLTGVDAVLADTGTLALRSGPGRSRLASLSVEAHIALFTADQIYASWADWWDQLNARAEWVSGASNLTLISGPSRTADIEMTLTTGVHGPGEVIVVLVQI